MKDVMILTGAGQMSNNGAFITGADFLIDGGATASYFYDELKPETRE